MLCPLLTEHSYNLVDDNLQVTKTLFSIIPEPSTLGFLGAGLLGAGAYSLRRGLGRKIIFILILCLRI